MLEWVLVNGSTKSFTGSATNVDDDIIENDEPVSVSTPLISKPLSHTVTNNCGASYLENTTASG